MMGECELAAGRTGVRTHVVGLPREVEEELLRVEEAIRNTNPGEVVFCRVAPCTVNAPPGQRSCQQQQQHAEHTSATSTRTPPLAAHPGSSDASSIDASSSSNDANSNDAITPAWPAS
jgi:hypothetical protein